MSDRTKNGKKKSGRKTVGYIFMLRDRCYSQCRLATHLAVGAFHIPTSVTAMEISNFIVWAVVVFGIAGFAITSMLSAFRKPIAETPFPDAVLDSPSIPLSSSATSAFTGAVGTYKAGDYRGAIEQLTPVVESEPNCAEAWHNIGLAYANVGDNNKAVRSLLKASEAYDKQATKSGIDRIKQDLKLLALNS